MLAKRALLLKPSPTLALAAKAKELAAQGKDVISLSVGEPDWDTFPTIKKAGIEALQSGQTKYAPANGTPELRRFIAEKTSDDLGVKYDPMEVSVTAGAKMVVFAALQVLCDPNDEVIIPSPYWVSYPTMVELADGKPVIVDCSPEQKFKLKASQLQKAITSRTKVLILNSPSNPTGEVYTRQELTELAEVLRQNPKVMVISDDIYNYLVFDEKNGVAPHLLHVAPDLRDRVVVVNGASKSFSMTGWRLGWALGAKPIMQAMTNYLSQSVSCASPFTQTAVVAGFQHCWSDLEAAVKKLHERCVKSLTLLQAIAGVKVQKPGGAFYLWPDISSFLGGSYRGRKLNSSKDFAEALLEHHWVAVVPGVEFGMEGYLRLSYVIDEKKMTEAISRFKKFVGEIERV